MIQWWHYLIAIPLVIGVIGGIVEDIAHRNLGPKLNDWPRRKGGKPYDRHSAARQDGQFVDGMITGAMLDEIDHMFD